VKAIKSPRVPRTALAAPKPILSRAALLRRGAGGGALLLVGAGLAAPADAADIPDGDLPHLRLLVAAELAN
jgi:hypothetical protein